MNKKFYFACAVAFALASTTYAQETISFETNEGYIIGSLNEQNGWEVTEGYNGFLTNQIITDERASDGILSFKNGHQSEYNPQWLPIFGSSKAFETPYSYQEFTISYDVYISQRNGADFEFNLYGINANEEYVPVVGIGMENRGYIYITKNTDYEFEYADAGENWPLNAWNSIRIEVNANQINYYLNGTLIHTTPNFTQTEIKGLTILHNNYGGDAFYDNFKINEVEMNTSELAIHEASIYPNPVKENLFVHTIEEVQTVEIYNGLGQLEMISKGLKSVDTNVLKPGNYIAKITFKDGKTMTKKFIKK